MQNLSDLAVHMNNISGAMLLFCMMSSMCMCGLPSCSSSSNILACKQNCLSVTWLLLNIALLDVKELGFDAIAGHRRSADGMGAQSQTHDIVAVV